MYSVAFIIGALCYFSYRVNISNILRKYIDGLFYILVIVAFATRGNDIPDTLEYFYIYNNPYYYEIESGFLYLINMAHIVNLSFGDFILACTFILVVSWVYITAQLTKNVSIAFFFFYSYMGLFYYGIILRASIAITICYLAVCLLLKNRNYKGLLFYYLLVSFSLFFHQTMLVFFILPIFLKIHIRSEYLFVSCLLVSFISFFNLQHFILDIVIKVLGYLPYYRFERYIIATMESGEYTNSLLMLKFLLFSLFFIYMKKNVVKSTDIYMFFLQTYTLGYVLLSVLGFFASGGRLALIFLFFEFALLTIIYNEQGKKPSVFFGLFILSCLNFLGFLYKFPMFAL